MKGLLRKLIKPKYLMAIDIGSFSTKIVEMTRVKGQMRLSALGSITTPPIHGGRPNPEELAKAISKLLSISGVTAREVIISLPLNNVIVHQVLIPGTNLNDWQTEMLVMTEAEKYFSQQLQELTVRYVNLGTKKSKDFLKYLLIAAPTNLVEEYYHIFMMAGLKIVAIDFPAFGLWRLFRNAGINQTDATAEAVALLEIGHLFSQLVIIKDGEIEYINTLACGAGKVKGFIASGYRLSWQTTKGSQEEWGELALAIKGALDEYSCQPGNVPIKGIVLIGGAAKEKGLAEYLGERCGITVEVQVPDCWRYLVHNHQEYDPSYASVLGLALREVEL